MNFFNYFKIMNSAKNQCEYIFLKNVPNFFSYIYINKVVAAILLTSCNHYLIFTKCDYLELIEKYSSASIYKIYKKYINKYKYTNNLIIHAYNIYN